MLRKVTYKTSDKLLTFFEYIIVYGWMILILAPFLWIVSLALRETQTLYFEIFIPKNITLSNFVYLFRGQFPYRNIEINFFGSMLNSVFVTGVSVVIILIIAIIASYGFTFLKFSGRKIFFYLFLSGIMLPVQVVMLPLVKINKSLQLQNSLFSIILPYTALLVPFSIFLLTGFFKNIPEDLLEAARIEGANEWQILLRIVIPLSRPAIAANIIIQFLWVWNEFALALALLRKPNMFTLPIEISKVQGQYMTPWNIVAVSVLCAIIPVLIVYIVFQKYFIAGLTSGALKE